MDLNFSPEDVAFREEVRAFIEASYPKELEGKQEEGREHSSDRSRWAIDGQHRRHDDDGQI